MAFLLYYDAGQAALIADGVTDAGFWDYLIGREGASPGLKLRRGTERRHFRGDAAMKALKNFKSRPINQPWAILQHMYRGNLYSRFPENDLTPTYTNLYQWMTTAYAGTQFGPYFIWKLYDIFNVCLDMPITLSPGEALRYMPDEPRKAAIAIFGDFEVGLSNVTRWIQEFDHPVRPGKCGLAEAETVLCMLKGAFLTKSHTVGDDIVEKWEQLREYPELYTLLPGNVAGMYKLGELTR